MFTIFDAELDCFARHVLAEQRAFENGDIPPEALHTLQWERLRETVRYVRDRSPFYHERLAWLRDSDIAELNQETLSALPFTTKDDLRHNLSGILSRPIDEAWVFYETTGTTGAATPCPRDNRDSVVNNLALTVCYDTILRDHGARHVAAIMGPSELHSTGDTFGEVFRNLGHTVVKMWPHSPTVGFPRALTLLRELNVTVLVCTPGTAIALAKRAAERGLDPRHDFGVRVILALGELATPSMLENLGSFWGARVYNCMYASQEASILAACRADELLHTVPLNNYYEVVDPDTGVPVPSVDGVRRGELVVTSLYQGSKPLVRYRTGDLVCLDEPVPGPYPSTTLRPLGRIRDVLPLAGRAVTAYEIEDAIFRRVRGVLDYQLLIGEQDGEDFLTVRLETADEAARHAIDISALVAGIREELGVASQVRYDRLDAITGTGAMVSWKAARIQDCRGAEEPERLAALTIAGQRGAQ
jgi:phenylacetate-CoA ligase